MPHTVLFDDGTHKNVLLEDVSGDGLAVQANQHLIVHGRSGMILDPGGHKVYSKVVASTRGVLGPTRLDHIFLSHQDPDIVAAINGWLLTTDATAHVSALWVRFVAHFGLDKLVENRLLPIPDAGMHLDLGGSSMMVVPAHFLHSPGNFHLYDPVSKILYTGDLGASIGGHEIIVSDFDAHIPTMDRFHRRYMAGNRALRHWVRMIRALDIEVIAPQHGAVFRGKPMVERFLAWCEGLECGIDLLDDVYRLPA